MRSQRQDPSLVSTGRNEGTDANLDKPRAQTQAQFFWPLVQSLVPDITAPLMCASPNHLFDQVK